MHAAAENQRIGAEKPICFAALIHFSSAHQRSSSRPACFCPCRSLWQKPLRVLQDWRNRVTIDGNEAGRTPLRQHQVFL